MSGEYRRERLEGWLLVAVLGLVAWLPLPYGSNEALWIGLMEVVVFVLLAVWMLANALSGSAAARASFGDGASLRVLLLLFLWLFYQALQLVPLPLPVVGLLNPSAADLYRYAFPESSGRLYTLSLDPGASLAELLKAMTYVALFFMIGRFVRTRKQLRLVATVLVVAVSMEAVWGIWGVYAVVGARASGTYVNPNHFAGLLEMGIGLTLGLLLALYPESRRDKGRGRQGLRGLLRGISGHGRLLYVYLALLVLFGALALSASRGGFLALLAAMALVLSASFVLRRGRGREAALSGLAVLALILGIIVFGADTLMNRFDHIDLDSEGRRQTAEASLLMIQSYPVFGSGSGTWGGLYPMFKSPEAYSNLTTTYAHNDHLELLAEQGILGYVTLGSAILLALWICLTGLQRRDSLVRGMSLGCALALVSLLIHAWVEFNFHIPANAAWFFVILGLGLAASRLPDAGSRHTVRRVDG